MKRLMMYAVLGALLAGTTGCRVAECWRYAWNSRFHPQQQQQAVIVSDPCAMESPCDSCGGGTIVSSPCSSCSN
jgi:hypothetical protein